MTTRVAGDYVETINPKGYISNGEITNLPDVFLVKGSKNVRIINKEKVASSKRYTLKGAAKDVNSKITTSYDWKTNTHVYRNIRGYVSGTGEIEVWYENVWTRIKNNFPTVNFQWAEWWSTVEQQDLLLGVRGDNKVYMWSGGIAEIASATTNTLTKKGYISSKKLSFQDNVATNDTITDSTNGFLDAGFKTGDSIKITGSTTNDGEYTIESVTAGVITLIDSDILETEAEGATVVCKLRDSGTWSQSRFLVNTTGRAVLIGGIRYTYTGGEDTGTLTGLSRNPVADGVISGDTAMQDFVEDNGPLTSMDNDFIATVNNHVYIGSSTSREIYISSNTDYTNFAYTTPLRIPGEGFKMTIDSACAGFAPDENDMYVTGGDDDWYKVVMKLTSDQIGESVVVKKLKTAPGQAALGQGAIAHIKNSIAFVSSEKVVDTIGNIENILTPQTTPISDDIKDDMESYNLTDVHALYFRRSLYIAVPAEGLVLEYDFRFGYWQPPQELPVQRLAIIDDRLCGHSSNSNETYVLYDGYNDNGAIFRAEARFGYSNYGTRFGLNNFDEIAIELYLSRSTDVVQQIIYDYKGYSGIREFTVSGSDDTGIIFTPKETVGLGKDKLGSNPLGGSTLAIDELVKARAVDNTTLIDFFEMQRVFWSESKDCRFEILAFGENVKLSENEAKFIKR